MKTQPTIGLFGTCGDSRWREPFIAAYKNLGIHYYNPQLPDWTPACAEAENEHFRHDAILLFPITAETTGFGSLAEVGLAILDIERSNLRKAPGECRQLLIFIESDCTGTTATELQIRESCRTRALVATKLPTYTGPHIQICSSLDDMLARSIRLADTMSVFGRTSSTLPHARSYWADPGKLLGGCFPGAKDPVEADGRLRALLHAGVSTFVSLMDPNETNHDGISCTPYQHRLAEIAAESGRTVQCLNFPIRDMSVPSVRQMVSILDAIDQGIDAGGKVYVHCWGGRGRTGTVVGAYLVRHGLATPASACVELARLTAHNREGLQPSPQTSEQRQFVKSWKTRQ